MLLAKVKLKLRRTKRNAQRPPAINILKLRDQGVRKAFQIEVKNRFAVLQEQEEIELHKFNEVLLETGKQLLGLRKRKKEE